jgi:hypothetical protein
MTEHHRAGTTLDQRARGWALAATGVSFIAAMTLVPQPLAVPLAAETPIWCLVCGALGIVDVLLNVLLFVPFGAGLRLAGLSWRRLMAVVFATTFTVELLQYTIVTGRDASLSDIVTNTAGGALGALAVALVPRLLRPGPRLRRALLAGWGGLWLVVVAATGWTEVRALPRSPYWGQWAPDLPGYATFAGTVLGATVNGEPVQRYRLANSAEVRAHLLADSTEVAATAVLGGPADDPAPVFSVFDREQRKIFMLSQHGRDAVFVLRTHASELRLRTPAIRLADALARAGDTVRVVAGYAHGRLFIAARDALGERATTVPLTPGLGWLLFLPFEYGLGPEYPLLTALWLLGWLAPLAYWSRTRDARAPVGAALLALAGLAGAPAAFGLPAARWWEWGAGGAGLMLGWWLRGRLAPARAVQSPPRARSASTP